jgi:phosphotransferase system  glucose/maltose/N-acetylglucosamine-specific IIC component
MDYLVIFLIHIYYHKFSFWILQSKFKIKQSEDTKKLKDEYLKSTTEKEKEDLE